MSRDNHYNKGGNMGNNAKVNQMVRDAARQVGIDPDELSDRVHSDKDYENETVDYSYSDLVRMANEIKKSKR